MAQFVIRSRQIRGPEVAVKLRLMRMGKKKQPTYRVVAADSRSPRNGRFIEIVGFYEPRQDPSIVKIDNDRAVHWLRHGAQPTDRVRKLLEISGALDVFRSPADSVASAVGTTTIEPVTDSTAGSAAVDSGSAAEVAEGEEPAGSGS